MRSRPRSRIIARSTASRPNKRRSSAQIMDTGTNIPESAAATPAPEGPARQARQAVRRHPHRRQDQGLLRPQLYAGVRRREGTDGRDGAAGWRDGPDRPQGHDVRPRHRNGLRRGEAAVRLRLQESEREAPLLLWRLLPRMMSQTDVAAGGRYARRARWSNVVLVLQGPGGGTGAVLPHLWCDPAAVAA